MAITNIQSLYIGNLFENNGKTKGWEDLRGKLDLDDNRKFYWIQIIQTILSGWKKMFIQCSNNISEHHY